MSSTNSVEKSDIKSRLITIHEHFLVILLYLDQLITSRNSVPCDRPGFRIVVSVCYNTNNNKPHQLKLGANFKNFKTEKPISEKRKHRILASKFLNTVTCILNSQMLHTYSLSIVSHCDSSVVVRRYYGGGLRSRSRVVAQRTHNDRRKITTDGQQ